MTSEMKKQEVVVQEKLVDMESRSIWGRTADFFSQNFTVQYKTTEERRFVRKLDLYLLTWGCISYCIKNIDQTNYKYAYVSGMKEDLNMVGNLYNLLGTLFTIGYTVSVIPGQMWLNGCNTAHFLSACELLWGVCTCLCAIPQTSVTYLYPLRFFIGVFESVSWCGLVYVFFNYYDERELSFRTGLLSVSTACGRAFTGFMQAAIYSSLEGKGGMPGWRYMFIINGLMTIVVAVFGIWFIPDILDKGGAKWMSLREVEIASERMSRVGRVSLRQFKLKAFIKVLKDYKFYVLILAYVPWDLGAYPVGYITLWLKALSNSDGTAKYTVEQINLIPGGGYLLAALSVIIITKYADISGNRIHCMVFQQLCGVVGCAILTAWPNSLGLKFFAFFLLFTVQSTGAIVTSFIPEIWAREADVRSVITSLIVVIDIGFGAWLPLLTWDVRDAPTFKYGYSSSLGFQTLSLVGCVLFYFPIYRRMKRKNLLECQQVTREVETDEESMVISTANDCKKQPA